MDGIRVVRVKTYITANEGFMRRTLDYVSFMVMSFIAGLFQSRPDERNLSLEISKNRYILMYIH